MANPRVQRDINDLNKELEEQIYLLESSIINFDQGHMEEGKRIATSLRILLHDTSQSHSLLGQLNVKDKLYYFDVARYYDGRNILSDDLLLNILAPRLHITPKTPIKQFDEWWAHQVVMSTGGLSPKTYTRKQLVLFLANQDGGAHVDPEMDQEFYEMTRNNKNGWFASNDESDIESQVPLSNDRIKLSVRTIAFELCATLCAANKSLKFRTIAESTQ